MCHDTAWALERAERGIALVRDAAKVDAAQCRIKPQRINQRSVM